ncbi:hypothetical protein GUB10_14380 [Salegentibacter sp. BLCTC]|uniref:hypothetical protein n=1 Tax=Salegentibacter sp. BLCTC TaxID=2697368 RepID=UPI00187B270F|nr:hypothetical protein [Salegentibacter sp. BLCTC]MBE7641524.1 hypothetical protein [Salegentibacter sp. BLCTC]
MNCKNYSIKPKDEVTISTIGEFAIITLEALGRKKVQYLVKVQSAKKDLKMIPERNLPEDYANYIIMALESISLYNEIVL